MRGPIARPGGARFPRPHAAAQAPENPGLDCSLDAHGGALVSSKMLAAHRGASAAALRHAEA
eukprot:6053338-Pyramimonas_sp.AAC.2